MDYNKDLAMKIFKYDNEAPLIFTNIKQFLFETIPYKIEVEHIGSTAVSNRPKYTELKTTYINEVLEKARREKTP